MLDGGLVANSPDPIALAEVEKAYPNALSRIQMLTIDTAGVAADSMARSLPRVGLMCGVRIAAVLMSAQERMAEALASGLLGGRYVRINHSPPRGRLTLPAWALSTTR